MTREEIVQGLQFVVGMILVESTAGTEKDEVNLKGLDKAAVIACRAAIEELRQEPKTGHWNIVSDGYGDNAYICECSECKDTVWVYKDADRKWKYCPNCGADMREVSE